MWVEYLQDKPKTRTAIQFFDKNGPSKVKGIFKRESQVHINGNEGIVLALNQF